MSTSMRKSMAALGVCGLAAGWGLLAAPTASAEDPAPLPASITDQIAHDRLPVQVSNGWEAVTGPASRVNDIRDLATSLGIGNVVAYTGDDESGRAILIFTGNHDDPVSFHVTDGTVVRSVDNDTDQAWYVYDDQGKPDAVVAPETARDIPPADFFLFNWPHNSSSTTTTTTTTNTNFNFSGNNVNGPVHIHL